MKHLTTAVIVVLLLAGCLSSSPSGDTNPTVPPVSTTPPKVLEISDVNAAAADTSADVSWTTNIESDSIVRYGSASGKYTSTEGGRDYVTEHEVNLEGLEPGATYYYRVGSVTPEGVATQSSEFNFTTEFIPPPSISDIRASATSTTARISWTSNAPTKGHVNYGNSLSSTNLTVAEAEYSTSHELVIQNLTPGNTYYYRVSAANEKGASSESPEASFTTPPAQSGELIQIGGLRINITGLVDHTIEIGGRNQSYSKAEIEVDNKGEDVIPVSITASAILNEKGDQFNRITLREPDEFSSADIFPGGKLHKAVYYEKVDEGPGTLHLTLATFSATEYSLKVSVTSPPPATVNETEVIETSSTEETKKSIEVTLDDFDPSFEIRTGSGATSKSTLYAKVTLTLRNIGDNPVRIRLDPEPGLLDEDGFQHLYARTSHKDELPLGTIHPGGAVSGALFFLPEIDRQTNSLTLILYVNSAKYEFEFNPGVV